MQTNNPRKTRVLYIDILQDENYALLERIASQIIEKFLEKGVTTAAELGHVKYDNRTQMY